ncbi:hypothetical protein AALA00_08760 [Lachnospiraceae bacterium 46-15]
MSYRVFKRTRCRMPMELQIFAEQAMSAFKAEKVKNQPDPGALQSQIA